MTPEEQENSDKMLDRVETLEKSIGLAERTQAAHDRLSISADPNQAAAMRAAHADGGSGADNRGNYYTSAFKTHDDEFPTLGAQLAAVSRAGMPGGDIDPRLNLVNRAAGLEESSPSEGGWLIQQEFVSTLMKRTYETAKLPKYCTKYTIGAGKNGLKINAIDESSRATGSRWGGIQAYWIAEASEKTKSKPKFCQIELDLNKLIGLCYATDELLEDAAALESIITQGFAEEFGFLLDDAIIRGTGAGMPRGVTECGVMEAFTRETENKVKYADILNMWARLWVGSRNKAVWFINQEVEPELYGMQGTCTSCCYPVFLPPGGISGNQYSSLMGRPIEVIEQASALGSSYDVMLLDLSQYILIDKGGIKSDQSIHVRFVYDEQCFRFVYRADGDCAWCSSLTPYKGTSGHEISPFVGLQLYS